MCKCINPKKLLQIERAVDLPAICILRDDNNIHVTDVVILKDGRVIDLESTIVYSSPKAIRKDLVSDSRLTYKLFWYDEMNLKDLMDSN